MALLKWSVLLFIIAAVMAVLGFTGVAEGLANVALVLFFIFLAGGILLVVLGIALFKKIT